jgi:hypothetical protein
VLALTLVPKYTVKWARVPAMGSGVGVVYLTVISSSVTAPSP